MESNQELKGCFSIQGLKIEQKSYEIIKKVCRSIKLVVEFGIFCLVYVGKLLHNWMFDHLFFHLHHPLLPLCLPWCNICSYVFKRTHRATYYCGMTLFWCSTSPQDSTLPLQPLIPYFLHIQPAVAGSDKVSRCVNSPWGCLIRSWPGPQNTSVGLMELAFIIPPGSHLRPINMHTHPGSP